MDRQTAIDRITETENLTDGLEDDDASWLLDWGIAHVDGLVTGVEDEDAAGEKLNQLMSVMRTLNQIASERAAESPDALATDIRTFLERYQQAFGAPEDATPPATPAPTADAQATPPTTTPAPAEQTGATQPKVTSASGQPPAGASTPTPAKKDETAPTTAPASPTPSSAPTPASATSPANTTAAGATQASQAPDQATQAASMIAGMGPKEAMQYLLSLAEAGAPAA
jgi:outer membrane biosynthesis protein TonB